jgi:hypothetical protein
MCTFTNFYTLDSRGDSAQPQGVTHCKTPRESAFGGTRVFGPAHRCLIHPELPKGKSVTCWCVNTKLVALIENTKKI